VRIGLGQISVEAGDIEKNKEKLNSLFEKYYVASKEPTAIVIPELWNTGYALEKSKDLASEEGREYAYFLGELARKYHVWFTGGSVLASKGENITNRSLIINPGGELVTYYDKVHLFRLMNEHLHLSSGKEICLYQLEDVKCGTATCYDIRFCEWINRYALNGASILFLSAEWPTARLLHWQTLLRARAIENQMFVAAVNTCGESNGTLFPGSSMVIDPLGEILLSVEDEERLDFVSIDLGLVQKTRETIPVFSDRVPDIYEKYSPK